jgi:hypothetical protein
LQFADIILFHPDGNWRDGKRGRLYKSGIWNLVSYGEMEIGEMEHWMVSYLNVAEMVCFEFGNWNWKDFEKERR